MDWLNRFDALIGKENLKEIKRLTVLVIGLGGVGGYALESIVRSGINKVIIVDKDIVDITNVNRQLIALSSNIGLPKVDVFEKRLKEINKDLEIIKINEFITKENINLLFDHHIDFIIDACDTLETKKELIRESIKRKIKIISSMGTANKLDPSKLKIMDIRKTSVDPLARIIRKMIKDENIKEKIPVICSDELPIRNSKNILGSNSFVPAVSGLLCTSYIINSVIDKEKIYEND